MFADTDPAIISGNGGPSTLSNISTVLIKSKDKALTLSASSALSELDGYRLIFCEDDNSAKSRLDEVNVDQRVGAVSLVSYRVLAHCYLRKK